MYYSRPLFDNLKGREVKKTYFFFRKKAGKR
jgi:hypothetical protein